MVEAAVAPGIPAFRLFLQAGFAASSGEARRLIEQEGSD